MLKLERKTKMNKLKLGGISFPSSIKFISPHFISTVDTKTEKIIIEQRPKKNKMVKFILKLPFIRGIAFLFYFMYIMFIKDIYTLLGIIVTYLLLNWIFGLFPINMQNNIWNWVSYILVIILIYLIRENHGAEHKLINAYESDGGLLLDNIKKQKKEHTRCGSTIISWMLIFSAILKIFNIPPPYWLIAIIFSVSYEISELYKYKYFHWVYYPSWILQKLVTKEPRDDILIKTKKGLEELLTKESQYNREATDE